MQRNPALVGHCQAPSSGSIPSAIGPPPRLHTVNQVHLVQVVYGLRRWHSPAPRRSRHRSDEPVVLESGMKSRQSADPRVSAAFAAVRREDFLTDTERRYASKDRPLPIGHGQTNSQPTTVRNMLTLLDVQPGDRVLDVGSGSGWTTALLGRLTGSAGRVYGVELVPDLAEWGERNLATQDMLWTSIQPVGQPVGQPAGDGVLGLPEHAPFDRILVSAEARRLPQPLVDQLGRGGRMVIPVSGRLSVVDRDAEGSVDVRRVGHYAFVPLR